MLARARAPGTLIASLPRREVRHGWRTFLDCGGPHDDRRGLHRGPARLWALGEGRTPREAGPAVPSYRAWRVPGGATERNERS